VIENLRSALRGPYSVALALRSCAAVAGPSGIGKSVFLRMVADLDPNSGTVRLDGADRAAMPAPRWRRLVTYVAAESGWWAETLGEHISDGTTARSLMPQVGLEPALLDAPVARLSTGERQRAALVRAIVGKPRFLLLDEPTSALDPESRALVEALLGRLKAEGMGLVTVSHDAAQARRIADRHFEMSATGLTEVVP
jgi:putative ABC transport system ATP-binding protein